MVGVLFGGSFLWPLLAVERPKSTWLFLQGAWLACIVVLFAVSRGVDGKDDEEDAETDETETADTNDGAKEST
jgi:hypothetical protein